MSCRNPAGLTKPIVPEEIYSGHRNKLIKHPVYLTGIDIGSTTSKIVILNGEHAAVFKDYRRHDTKIINTLGTVLKTARKKLGNIKIRFKITGSAGMGLSERLNLPFIQEVIASAELIKRHHPDARTLLDIGGEDSKLILIDGQGRMDIRMNGNCAGGTGAFIDQMATLLDIPFGMFNRVAADYRRIHPIASRCGVFAKTDAQALMSQGISKSDIAASVFNAVALQVVTTLSRGFRPSPQIIFSGGPLTFMPLLRKFIQAKIDIKNSDVLLPPSPELFPALGAALVSEDTGIDIGIDHLIQILENQKNLKATYQKQDDPLFSSKKELDSWLRNRFTPFKRIPLEKCDGKIAFLGIDAGSTTTKMVLTDRFGRIILDYYLYSKGDHISAVKKGLHFLLKNICVLHSDLRLMGIAVTGYGEDLIKAAFDIDTGIVETLAHYRAATHINKDASFILDIGGQDMKAVFTENQSIRKIELNEACSSGCGSFLQTFAEILNCPLDEFSQMACESKAPCDLGSRCTVFMNSRVKQSLREGAGIKDIAAGLAYAVVRNCLNKVLKINNLKLLGDTIIVQGGTFLNPSVHRAFEKLTGKKVYCPEISGLMGAFGCALHARDLFYRENRSAPKAVDLSCLGARAKYNKSMIHCRGCSNQCRVSRLEFNSSRIFYAGNRCEKIFSNGDASDRKGINFAEFKRVLLFDRPFKSVPAPRLKIGIPRAMNLYENFPFWCTLFVELGMEVVLSPVSDTNLYEKGAGTVMSDSICFPAKVAHGHIIDLIEKKVDRIFYPIVIYEHDEKLGSNTFNCPIVSGYPEVIKSAVNPERQYGIPFDTPIFSFKNKRLFKKNCFDYFKTLHIRRSRFSKAFSKAVNAHQKYKARLQHHAGQILYDAQEQGRKVLVMAIRPYHIDRFINHDIFEMLSQMGVDTITADALPSHENNSGNDLGNTDVLTQWAYTNWLYNAAHFSAARNYIEMVQLNSFGCGIDAIASDEISSILNHSCKNLTLIRIDEVVSPGSIRLRFRTLIESMKTRPENQIIHQQKRKHLPLFKNQDRERQILVPYFSKFYSPFIQAISESTGYNFNVLPPPDDTSVHVGLKYTNNEICYPAIITVGDIIKALQTGRYDPTQVAAGITQTGAQCRASNYVSLIKKGLLAAGYNLPVVTVHLKNTDLNEQPGFQYSKLNLMRNGLRALAFADAISLMYHSLIVREKNKGDAWCLVEKYIQQWRNMKKRGSDTALFLIKNAAAEFNRIPIHHGSYPKIGIVGEIYANYNEFCNHDIVNWLTQQQVEVELPSLMNFFTQGFVNFKVDMQKRLIKKHLLWPVSILFEKRVDMFLGKVNHALSDYRFFSPIPDIKDLADKASKIIDLSIQFGEGWLIPGEIVKMAEAGIENILCLQPFGCIANQVVAKGIEKRLKELYPNLNLLFIDLDANTSEANIFNRIHFLVRNAKMVSSRRAVQDSFSA